MSSPNEAFVAAVGSVMSTRSAQRCARGSVARPFAGRTEFPKDSVKRPQYFGKLTNDIVYKRIAPGVLAKLKEVTPRSEDGRLKHKYFQRLTSNVGYPKLLQHLGSVVSIMKLSDDWKDFSGKLDRLHPRYGDTLPLPMDDGKGI
jgi:hypothetical protein